MKPALADTLYRRTAAAVLVLSFVAAHGGGLGLVPLAAMMGVIGIAISLANGERVTLGGLFNSEWLTALFLFLAWAFLSTFWSPYSPSGVPNAAKLILGAAVFEAGRRLITRAAGTPSVYHTTTLQNIVIYWPIVAALILCLDLVTDFGLSFAIDPVKADEDMVRRRADAIMNTANGVVWLTVICAASFTLMLWTRYRGPIFCVLLLTLIVISAIINGLSAAIIAVLLSVLSMAGAAYYPKKTINLLTGAAVAAVGFAPLLAGAAQLSSSAFRAALPFSWEHRIVTWDYIGERIKEHPILGHGFDASRTFDATFDARGFTDLAVVSLHPHNAGLQIWVETGVIGAVLACTAIILIGKEAHKYAAGGRARAIAAAGTMTPILVFASVSYGVWQEWWWATFFLSAGILALIPRTKQE